MYMRARARVCVCVCVFIWTPPSGACAVVAVDSRKVKPLLV